MHGDTGGEDQREGNKSSTYGKCGKGKSRVGHNDYVPYRKQLKDCIQKQEHYVIQDKLQSKTNSV